MTKELAPSDKAFPDDLDSPPLEHREKNIFLCSMRMMMNPCRVSDSITEKDGYLCLTEEQYKAVKSIDPDIIMSARQC